MMGFFHRDAKGNETPVAVENAIDDDASAATGTLMTTQADPGEIAKLRAELAERDRKIEEDRARIAALEKTRLDERVAAVKADADRFATNLVTSSKLLPAGREPMANLHAFAQLSAAGLPTEGIDPVASLNGVVSGLVPHNLTAEALGDSAAAPMGKTAKLENGSRGDDAPMTEARCLEILESHPDGPAAIALLRKNGSAH